MRFAPRFEKKTTSDKSTQTAFGSFRKSFRRASKRFLNKVQCFGEVGSYAAGVDKNEVQAVPPKSVAKVNMTPAQVPMPPHRNFSA